MIIDQVTCAGYVKKMLSCVTTLVCVFYFLFYSIVFFKIFREHALEAHQSTSELHNITTRINNANVIDAKHHKQLGNNSVYHWLNDHWLKNINVITKTFLSFIKLIDKFSLYAMSVVTKNIFKEYSIRDCSTGM